MSCHWPSSVPFPRSLGVRGATLCSCQYTNHIDACRIGLTLQEVCGSLPHSGVDVCFGSLDVVVEVVSESLNVGDDRRHLLGGEVPWEEDLDELAQPSL